MRNVSRYSVLSYHFVLINDGILNTSHMEFIFLLFYFKDVDQTSGDILPNGTSFGVFGAIYREEMDFRVGVYRFQSDRFSISFNVARSAPMLLVPAPKY